MIDQTLELEGNDFVAVAIRHGLLQQHHVEKILLHARETNVQPSDAALTLSMLELYEVDAIHLLCQPSALAPGYVLTGLIGCGAGGMVFRAHQTTLGRDIALKTINVRSRNASTTGQSRMQREAHAIARLQHPHIVTAYDSGFHQGRFCIAMELVEGETLSDFIRRESPVAEDIAWRIARQVASALSHANDAGITHRDIKPANLLLGKTPSGMELAAGVPFVKVADFGLAFESHENDESQLTATGVTLGTPAYVAPEQLHDTHVDARADIYSLGATVYHMLTGAAPCSDRSPMRTIMQKTIGDDRWRAQMPAVISAPTVALFRDMTETKVEDRIGDYHELISRIDELLGGAQPALTIASPPTKLSRLPRVSQRMVVITSSILIGLIAVFWLIANQGTEVSTPTVAATEWNVDGFPQPLFNGQSVPLFRQSGNWSPGIANDGGRVLVGKEGSRITIPLTIRGDSSPNMRLRIGVHVEKDSVVEMGLLHSDQETECGMLRFQNNQVDFQPSPDAIAPTPAKSISLSPSSPDESVFQRINIQREGETATLIVNGETIGSVGCNANAITSIQLRCIEQESRFADIDIVRLSNVDRPPSGR